jgi:uncharacterized protein
LRFYEHRISPGAGFAILALIAIGGLFYVKWLPYYHKALVASASHSIGRSILMGTSAQAPPPSWKAALDYSLAYGKAIWQAMVLGLLLGAAVQEFAPMAWIARALGRSSWRSVVTGGLLAIPGMMCTCCAAPVVIGLQHRTQSSDPGVHGLRLGLEMDGTASGIGYRAGVRHRIPHQPMDSSARNAGA